MTFEIYINGWTTKMNKEKTVGGDWAVIQPPLLDSLHPHHPAGVELSQD